MLTKPDYQPTKQQLAAIAERWNLDNIDRAILRYLILAPQSTITELGIALKISRHTIAFRLNRPAFKEAHRESIGTVDELLQRGVEAALRRLTEIVRFGDDKLAIEAAKVLALPYFSPRALGPQKQQQQMPAPSEIVFQTQIGKSGEIMREQINSDTIDAVALPAKQEPCE